MELCDFCWVEGFGRGHCYVCKNNSKMVGRLIEKANDILASYSSYALSIRVPSDWVIREEEVWERTSHYVSIKHRLNRFIKSSLNGRFEKEGEVLLIFDFNTFDLHLHPNDLFIFGRYVKNKPGLSQTRWACSSCDGRGCVRCGGKGKLYTSVEEIIGEVFCSRACAEDYVLHASGREDIDAVNRCGRPFVLRLKKAKNRSFSLDWEEREGVILKDLKFVGREKVELITESHFDKAYRAHVLFKHPPTNISSLAALSGKIISQRTPLRVKARRADLVRKRKIFEVKVEWVEERRALLYIRCEAGTYVKEFVSGDNGRTTPSVSELCGPAECTFLEVVEIDDLFLRTLSL